MNANWYEQHFPLWERYAPGGSKCYQHLYCGLLQGGAVGPVLSIAEWAVCSSSRSTVVVLQRCRCHVASMDKETSAAFAHLFSRMGRDNRSFYFCDFYGGRQFTTPVKTRSNIVQSPNRWWWYFSGKFFIRYYMCHRKPCVVMEPPTCLWQSG